MPLNKEAKPKLDVSYDIGTHQKFGIHEKSLIFGKVMSKVYD